MTKSSAMVTAGALVLALMAGVAARDLAQPPPPSPTQIVVQIGSGGSTATTTTTAPRTTAPARGGEEG
jgi:hypothetical protein